VHAAAYTWYEGRAKGTVHACLAAWRHVAILQREVRAKEAEAEKLHGSYQERLEEERRKHDREVQEKLAAIEARARRGHRDIEVVIAKWERGSKKGLLSLVVQTWGRLAQRQRSSAGRRTAVEMQVRRWAEGSVRGSAHCCLLHWKSLAAQASLAGKHQVALEAEAQRLQRMLEDAEKAHKDLQLQHASEAEIMRARARSSIEMAVDKWKMGDRRGLLRASLQLWHKFVGETKRLGRKRQSVHDALMRSLEGEKRAALHISFLNWHGLARSEGQVRASEERSAQEAKQWEKFLAETQQEHEDALGQVQDAVAAERARAHQATELMLRKWMGGDSRGLLATAWADWRRFRELAAKSERKRNAVKSSVLRFVDGERRGAMHAGFMAWRNFVRWEAKHHRLHGEKDAKIDELERRLQQMVSHKETRLAKYAELLGSRRAGVVKGTCFAGWREESRGAQGRLEAQRRQEVQLEEMERLRKMGSTLHKEWKMKAAVALGCKDGRAVLFEVFLAWSYLVQQHREQWAMKCNHNEAMLRYSSFIIGKKLKKDSEALLTTSFSEWHRESKILFHHRHREQVQRSAEESRNYVAQVEQQRGELQEQLCLVAETLQKELKTKEELASELRNAYSKMRRVTITPTSTHGGEGDRLIPEAGVFSRTSSDQTLDPVTDQVPTPRAAPRGTPGGPPQWRLGATPELLRCNELLRSRGGRRIGLGASSREASPPQVDWDHAVARLDEEGIVRMERTRGS